MASNTAKGSTPHGKTRRARTPAERRKGWIVIALVAIGTLAFFVAGTIDPQTRYDWIKL